MSKREMSGREMSGRRMSCFRRKDYAILAGKFKFLGTQMVQTLPIGLAPASGLIRLRSGHHYEVRLGLWIIFMYNMSI